LFVCRLLSLFPHEGWSEGRGLSPIYRICIPSSLSPFYLISCCLDKSWLLPSSFTCQKWGCNFIRFRSQSRKKLHHFRGAIRIRLYGTYCRLMKAARSFPTILKHEYKTYVNFCMAKVLPSTVNKVRSRSRNTDYVLFVFKSFFNQVKDYRYLLRSYF
jgi:hypothetical protein